MRQRQPGPPLSTASLCSMRARSIDPSSRTALAITASCASSRWSRPWVTKRSRMPSIAQPAMVSAASVAMAAITIMRVRSDQFFMRFAART
ncbi:hypothetical protein [Sphingobium sp. HWE2-09]|uniref:hypothetical protein n=1 Tax=Sphingobium sp. HWE2-09 TaxID=3108390 RepID=UPI002DC43E31|nr:hypothetical protein [Sphingobium sp. HWE2-09]